MRSKWDFLSGLTFSKAILAFVTGAYPLLSPGKTLSPEEAWERRSSLEMACYAYEGWKKTLDFSSEKSLEITLRSCFWCTLMMKYEKKPEKQREEKLKECLEVARKGLKNHKHSPVIGFWTAVL